MRREHRHETLGLFPALGVFLFFNWSRSSRWTTTGSCGTTLTNLPWLDWSTAVHCFETTGNNDIRIVIDDVVGSISNCIG
jgi:hypothetical protein